MEHWKKASKRNRFGSWTTAVVCVSLLAACNATSGADNPAPPSKQEEPVELTILSLISSITQEEFQRTMEAPIRKKYPHYTLNYIIQGKEMNLANMVTAGTPPDILITSLSGMHSSWIPYKLEHDLTPLIQKHKYDLSRIDPSTIESLRNASGSSAIYGLPKYTNSVVMFYNKDIFDKFGVAYPKDGITWDETIKLAGQMIRGVDGIQYRGLGLFSTNMIIENQLSLPLLDPKADKAAVNVPEFQRMFQTYKSVYDLVGNKPPTAFNGDKELTAFHKDKNIAMVLSPMSGYGRFEADQTFNWDLVAAPTFSDKPGIGFQANTIYYFISDVNKKAEPAFLTVSELLSDEAQLLATQAGRPTVLNSESIRAALGQGSESTKNKNMKALFYNKFAPTPPPNPKLAPLVNANSILNKEFGIMIDTGTDVNTMLRQAEEKINQEISKAINK